MLVPLDIVLLARTCFIGTPQLSHRVTNPDQLSLSLSLVSLFVYQCISVDKPTRYVERVHETTRRLLILVPSMHSADLSFLRGPLCWQAVLGQPPRREGRNVRVADRRCGSRSADRTRRRSRGSGRRDSCSGCRSTDLRWLSAGQDDYQPRLVSAPRATVYDDECENTASSLMTICIYLFSSVCASESLAATPSGIICHYLHTYIYNPNVFRCLILSIVSRTIFHEWR